MKLTSKKQIEKILKNYPRDIEPLRIDLNLLVLIAQREQLIEDRDETLKIISNI